MLRAHIPRKVSLFVGAEYNSEATLKAMEAARNCAASGLSPGAGLATAEEQAEVWQTMEDLPKLFQYLTMFWILFLLHTSSVLQAAYADMINTTIDQKGISLSEGELIDLNRGGQMWEKGAIPLHNYLITTETL